jgi:hypothetical protein
VVKRGHKYRKRRIRNGVESGPTGDGDLLKGGAKYLRRIIATTKKMSFSTLKMETQVTLKTLVAFYKITHASLPKGQ